MIRPHSAASAMSRSGYIHFVCAVLVARSRRAFILSSLWMIESVVVGVSAGDIEMRGHVGALAGRFQVVTFKRGGVSTAQSSYEGRSCCVASSEWRTH